MKKKKNMSIRKIIIFTFVISILVSTVFIGNIVFSNWISSINKITQKMSADINKEISNQINSFLNVPKHINEVNEKTIKNGIVNFSDEEERDRYFVGVMQTHKNEIYSFTYGMENGEFYGARRNEKDDIEIVRNNSNTAGSSWYYSVNEDFTSKEVVLKTDKFDARTRYWYKAAKMAGKATFSPIYKHFVMNDLTVSAATPIYDSEGKLQGVLGTHIVLSNINDYMHEIIKDYGGYAAVIEKNSDMSIANSFGNENFTILEDGSLKRYNISELDNKMMSGIFKQYNITHENDFGFIYEKTGYYVDVFNYKNDGLDWIIISAIPNNIFTQEIYENIKITVLIIFITILLVVCIYLFIIKQIFKPIDDLILVSNQITLGDLSKRSTVVRNDEIGKLSNAFNIMAEKTYQLVNNLEGKVKERTGELEYANDELNKIKKDLYLILDTTAEGIFGIDTEGKIIFCNDSCIDILGYKCQEDLIGKNVHSLIHYGTDDESILPQHDCKILKSLSACEKLYVKDDAFWKADGTKIDVEYHSYPKLKDEVVTGAVVTFTDITEKKKDEEQIQYLSCHDSLTGLFNRRCYESNLKQIDNPSSLPISIIFGDLNGLKLMNDIFGHVVGDKLIQKAAEVLGKSCRDEDIIARVGGDEFIVVLPKTDATHAMKIMQRIKSELSKEKVYDVKCSMSMGVDTKIEASQNVEKIMGNAESEMYKEKSLSRKNYGIDTIQAILKILQDRSAREKVHSERVALLCEKMGRAMGLTEYEVKRLKDAGYIHDIGKIVLEEGILRKGELNEKERQQMKQHPVVGYRILNLFDNTLDLAEGVYAHHESWNGMGYPKGLKGEEIPLVSRIISIADSYEKKLAKNEKDIAYTIAMALKEINEQSGKNFDPKLTELFMKVIKEVT